MDHPVHGWLEGRPRHRATVERGARTDERRQERERERQMTEGGVRGTVDNNNYYTRRSFANAVLWRKGVSGEGRAQQGGLLDEASAGETLRCPLSHPVRSGRREKRKKDE